MTLDTILINLSRAVRTSSHALQVTQLCLIRSTSMDPVRGRVGP